MTRECVCVYVYDIIYIYTYIRTQATEALRDFCIRKVTEPDNTLAPPVGTAVGASSGVTVCVCMCVCVCERERGLMEQLLELRQVWLCVCICMCVCVRERASVCV